MSFCQGELYGTEAVCPHCYKVITAKKRQGNGGFRWRGHGDIYSSGPSYGNYETVREDTARLAHKISLEQLKIVFSIIMMLAVLVAIPLRWKEESVNSYGNIFIQTYKLDRFANQTWCIVEDRRNNNVKVKVYPEQPYSSVEEPWKKRRTISLGLGALFAVFLFMLIRSRKKLQMLLEYGRF